MGETLEMSGTVTISVTPENKDSVTAREWAVAIDFGPTMEIEDVVRAVRHALYSARFHVVRRPQMLKAFPVVRHAEAG